MCIPDRAEEASGAIKFQKLLVKPPGEVNAISHSLLKGIIAHEARHTQGNPQAFIQLNTEFFGLSSMLAGSAVRDRCCALVSAGTRSFEQRAVSVSLHSRIEARRMMPRPCASSVCTVLGPMCML